MRKLVDFNDVKNIKDFWFLFILANFPESYDEETEEETSMLIEKNNKIDGEWLYGFTNYIEEEFEINDGYTENPNTISINLSTGNTLYIEFHPGDTIFFIDDKCIGCTGPHYDIHKFSWSDFCKLTEGLSDVEKFLLVPMLYINDEDKEVRALFQLVSNAISSVLPNLKMFKNICAAIVVNCIPEE